MKYYLLNTIGDDSGDDLCILGDMPEEFGAYTHLPAMGEKASGELEGPATIRMSEDYPGIVTRSLLGNVILYMTVCTAMKDVVLEHCPPDSVECIPFTLYNHKGRIHSKDYWIVNPLTIIDCLDPQRSDIKYNKKGQLLSVWKHVLDAAKLKDAPGLFRMEKDVQKYVIDDRLLKAFRKAKFTNVLVNELPVS